MKKIIFFLICILFICLTHDVYAQNDSLRSTAKIYIIRATGFDGTLVNFRVLIDDELYCKISNNRYSIINIRPGKYTFYVTSWAKPRKKKPLGLELEVEKGKTYYLRMVIKDLYYKDPYYFEEITYNSALPLLEKYKEDTDCDN